MRATAAAKHCFIATYTMWNATLLFLALALASTATASFRDIECVSPDYCSAVAGITGYIGPLDTADQVKAAFAATHYKKEIIIFAESSADRAVHTLDRYRRAGISHVLTILGSAEDCQRLRHVFKSYDRQVHTLGGRGVNVSCGWYRTTDDSGKELESQFEYLRYNIGCAPWWRKYITAARAVALGYNMMAIDQDTMMLGDFYKFAKSPQGSEFTMYFQSEDPNAINAGFVYVQNAAPNGPAFYILYEAVHRAVRWAEDHSVLEALAKSLLLGDNNNRFYRQEQTLLTDCLFSCMAGRPVHRAVLQDIRDDEAGWAKLGGKQAAYDYVDEITIKRWYRKTLTLDMPLAESMGGDSYPDMSLSKREGGRMNISFRSTTLLMPHSGGEFPKILGGNLFGPVGPYTRAYRKSFADLGVPLIPDPDDPNTAAAAKATKPELFAFTNMLMGDSFHGGFVESTWLFYGRMGYWNKAMAPKYTTLVGHVHAHLGPSDDGKIHVLTHTGNFNWALAAALNGGPARAFLATENDEHAMMTLSRGVVAYAPGVIHYGLNKDEYVRAVEQLARVAMSLNAVAAWPDVDCSSDWALLPSAANLSKPIRHTVPWVHLDTRYQVLPFGRSPDRLKCEWSGVLTQGCTSNYQNPGRGLLAVEFDHLLEQRNIDGPDPAHTIRLTEPGAATLPVPPASSKAVHHIKHRDLVSYNADLVLGTARWGQPLWLDRLVEVEGLAGKQGKAYDEWRLRCRALRYRELEPREREAW